jgi:hypothetical protein
VLSGNTVPASNLSREEVLANQYKDALIELAKQDTYIISVQSLSSGSARKVLDPFDHTKLLTVYTKWEEKKYKRHKITVADYQKVKELSESYNDEEEEQEEEEEEDDERYRLKKIDQVLALYQFFAQCYLKMSPEEFMRADWGQTRPILDACNYRTVHSLAHTSKALYQYFHLEGEVQLTHAEAECIRRYRLWTGKAKTKPAEYNGGIWYEEDLNEVLKMEELDISGRNYKAKKSQSKGNVGADGDVHRKTTRVRNA